MNDTLGKAAVRLGARYLRHRYRRELRIGIGIAVVAFGVAVAYVASRNVPEG
jgi:hypothetical protein